MSSETDSIRQQNIIRQLKKNKNNSILRIITISLIIFLLVVNIIFIYQAALAIVGYMSAVTALAIFIPALVLIIIDFIAVLFYVIIKHPHGIARILSDAILIIVSLILLLIGGILICNYIIFR